MSNMLHLSTDRLAALGDEEPMPAEASHLASCDACARERDAYRSLVAMAGAERAPLGMPLTRWDAIAAALAVDAPAYAPRAVSLATRWPLRVAAGVLLLVGGTILGRVSAGADLLPSAGTNRLAATAAAHSATVAAADSVFASVDEARAAQRRSEQLYQQAVAYLAQYDSTATNDGSPVAYKSRLAALDRVISATSAAMREAPHDPVINGYYLTTLGQREATIRQLNTALPASLRLNSF
jgi:hypothetical protein